MCQDLLGPETWEPGMIGCAWSSNILGVLDKRLLLKQVVIPAMAKEKMPLAKQVGKGACRHRRGACWLGAGWSTGLLV
jgi:hypothetical protein